jgi:hypothetical protein
MTSKKASEHFFFLFEIDATNMPPMEPETTKAFLCSGAYSLKGPKILFNETQLHRAELPIVNGITNARSLARIYSLLISDINENGKTQKCLLSEKNLLKAITNVTPQGEPDQNWYNMATTFTKGSFQVYDDCFNILEDGVFGHSG